MAKSTSSYDYEEKRKQTMAENFKRMAQLNLHTLSLSFKSSLPSRRIKRRYVRKRKMSDAPPRRSPRNLMKKTSETNHIQQRAKAVERAKKLELRLGSTFPTFIKPLLQSHLRGCLYMPRTFCKTHLPDDKMVTLIDEDGGQWQLKYHVLYHSLLYGWKKFSIDHQLVAGDVIVFQLIGTTFKVYIIRVNSEDEE
ncbi:unnamed protein product [Amaranthus hypochondriacus]